MADDIKEIEISAADLPLHCPTKEVPYGVLTRGYFLISPPVALPCALIAVLNTSSRQAKWSVTTSASKPKI